MFILILREGRAGEAWEPSNKELLSLPLSLLSSLPLHSPAEHFFLLFYNFICLILYREINAVCFAFRRLYSASIIPPLQDIHPRLSVHKHSIYQSDFMKIDHTLFSIRTSAHCQAVCTVQDCTPAGSVYSTRLHTGTVCGLKFQKSIIFKVSFVRATHLIFRP